MIKRFFKIKPRTTHQNTVSFFQSWLNFQCLSQLYSLQIYSWILKPVFKLKKKKNNPLLSKKIQSGRRENLPEIMSKFVYCEI